MSLPQAKELANYEPPQPTLEELRRKIDPNISDDELFLRLNVSEEAIKAMRAAGPIKTDYPRVDKPVVTLIQELMKRRDLNYIEIQKGDFSLKLKKKGG